MGFSSPNRLNRKLGYKPIAASAKMPLLETSWLLEAKHHELG